MSKPVRLQLSRKKGFLLQEHSLAVNGLQAVNVARPTVFGNPFRVKAAEDAGYHNGRQAAVLAFEQWMRGSRDFADYKADRRSTILNLLPVLSGKNLACWCGLSDCCHADVLLKLAADCE